MHVTGIGQCAYDYLAVVDSFPAVDTKKEVLRLEEQGGGPVATALVTLSRMGIEAGFHGITGDDEDGAKIRQSLVDEGIDVSGLKQRPGAASQRAFIVIEQSRGKRTIFWKRPSGAALLPEELPATFLDNAAFLLLDGLMTEVSLFAAQKAKKAGVPVMLDAGRVREGIPELAGLCDYVVASEEFAKDLGWDDDAGILQREIGRRGFGVTTITLGERGSITFAGSDVITVPAFSVESVDTTGAGDVFHGGYVYGILQGWPLPETIRFASAAAAMKCRHVGGRSGIPGSDDVFRFLDAQGVSMPTPR